MTTLTYVAMNHRGPITTALTLEAAQRQGLRDAKQHASATEYDYLWVDHKPGEWQLLRKAAGMRHVAAEKTSWKVVAVTLTPDEATVVDGPFPIRVAATPSGAELDVSSFLFKAAFAELIAKADDDPEAIAAELSDMADLLRSAVAQGPNSHARHEFDEAMQRMIKEYANDGLIPLYGAAVGRLAVRLGEIAAPRPVPGQREAGAA
jgi:hypothetical protein